MCRSQSDGRIYSRRLLRLLLSQLRADSSLASSIGSSTTSKVYWTASRPRVTRKTMRMFRSCLNSWTIFETLSQIIRSVVVPDRFYGPLIHAACLDDSPTGNIQSESQTYCESPRGLF